MPVYGIIIITGLNWLLGFLGLGEKEAPIISDHTNTTLFQQFIFLVVPIVIGLWLLLNKLAEDKEINSNANEIDYEWEIDHSNEELDHFLDSQQGVQEHPSDELYHYFHGGDHHRAAAAGDDAGGRHGGCAFCGDFSTTRCSRCKTARYCSNTCQVRHWISEHKYECSESVITSDDARPTPDLGPSEVVEKSEMESTSNTSHGDDDGVKWNSETEVGVKEFSGNDDNNFHGCEVCGSASNTSCSRCKAVKYCSVKCLIMDWGWHKDHCIVRDVNSAHTETQHRDVGLLRDSHEEEGNIHPPGPLSLEFHPEGTTSYKSPIDVSKDSTNKVLCLEDKEAKHRNEILVLQSELHEWKNRANVAREQFHRLRKESNYQLLVLKNEKKSISDAEKKACNVINSLHARINHLQNAVQESLAVAEKRKLEEHLQDLKCECAKLKKELQEEHKRSQCLTVESEKIREAAQIAMKEVEVLRQELQEERKHARRLKENFQRDVIFAESKAVIAEAKLSDLYRKIKMSDYKVCSVCLSNEKDLAFGCGHMTCRDCGSKLSKCPICRELITNHIKLFPG